MSDYVFRSFEELNLSAKTRTSAEDKESKFTAIKFFVIIGIILIILEAIVFFIVTPLFSTNVKIRWAGVENSTVYDLTRLAGKSLEKSYYNFNEDEVCSILASVPGVEDVQIVKSFPDTVTINVIERKAVAMTTITKDGETTAYNIDKNGVIFPVVKNDSYNKNTVLVSGIPVDNVPEGMRIPAKFRPLLSQISRIQEDGSNLLVLVSEIHVVNKEFGNYELILYPDSCRTRILTDRALNEDSLQYMMVMISVIKDLGPNIEEIDLRYGSISYRTRG